MTTINELLHTIEHASERLSITQLLGNHPDLTRRTAQRWLSQLIEDKKVIVEGEGRARAYRVAVVRPASQVSDPYSLSVLYWRHTCLTW